MRVLVYGGRKFNDFTLMCNYLDYYQPDEIISGMAKGADSLAVNYAHRFKIPLLEFPADWDQYGRRAGPIRNQQMLDEGRPDLVIAFPDPGSKGTYHMIDISNRAGVEVIVVGPTIRT